MSDSEPDVRVRLLAPLAGHSAGAQLDHDAAGAGWLIAAGLAEAVEDEPEPSAATGGQTDGEGPPDAASERAARAPGATDRRRGGG